VETLSGMENPRVSFQAASLEKDADPFRNLSVTINNNNQSERLYSIFGIKSIKWRR